MYSKNAKKRRLFKIPVLFVMGIFVYENLVYNCIFLVKAIAALGLNNMVLAFGVPFNFLWSLTLWAFWRTSCTDPGRITEEFREFAKKTPGIRSELALPGGGWQPGILTKGKKSPEIRPERAHFCQVCEQDILRMDHFCPWTGNCVGFRNHKFFLQLTIYGLFTSAWAAITPIVWFVMDLSGHNDAADEVSGRSGVIEGADMVKVVIFEVLAFLVTLAFLTLVCCHLPLAWENKTSIEDMYDNMDNPYEQRSKMKNLEEVFGVFGWDWFFPVMPRHPVTDGFSFRKTDEQLPEPLVELMETEDTARGFETLFDDLESAMMLWKFRYGADKRDEKSMDEPKGWFSRTSAWLLGS